MHDDDLKRMLEYEMKREAELIMEEVNADPTLKDVKCPEEVHDKLFEEIRLYEEQRAQNLREQLSYEDRELLRLGKIYRKRRKMERYVVLAAAIIAIFAFGTVSIGKNESIFNAISRFFLGEEQVVVNSNGTEPVTFIDEIKTYEEIEKEYGFRPVKLEYLPNNIGFLDASIGTELQEIVLNYGNEDEANIIYNIRPKFRNSSIATHVEDEKMQEYKMVVSEVDILIKEYFIKDSGENRWYIQFKHDNVQYFLSITDMEQSEVEKIINDLGF